MKRICKTCKELLPNYFFGHSYNSNCKLCNLIKTSTDLTDKEAKKYEEAIHGIQEKRTIPNQMTWRQIKEKISFIGVNENEY